MELLSLCSENDIDLLALGALMRENMFKVFSASIARDVCRKAKVSLLLLTHSSIMEEPCERIACKRARPSENTRYHRHGRMGEEQIGL